MGFNSAFKGLMYRPSSVEYITIIVTDGESVMVCEGDGRKHKTVNKYIEAVLIVSKMVDLEGNAGKLSMCMFMPYQQNSGRNRNLKIANKQILRKSGKVWLFWGRKTEVY
jgi:hypothetical protein